MDVKELRDKLYEEYKDDLESCMSQYSHKFNYQDIADDVMDNVSKYFYGKIRIIYCTWAQLVYLL